MDIQTTIVIAIFLLLFIIPFWLLIRANKAKEKKFINRLLEVGRQHQIQFTEQEIWNEKAIGIDTAHKKVVFLNLKLPAASEMMIDLNQMSGCKLYKQGEVKQGMPARDAKVELQFTPKQSGTSAPSLVFFDMNVDDPLQMNVCQEKAKAWLQRIEACLQRV